MPSIKYSKEILANAVSQSDSVSSVMTLLGMKRTGGNHSYISRLIKLHCISTDHFTYSKNTSGISSSKRKSAYEILVVSNNSLDARTRSSKLTRALLEIGVPYKCNKCEISEWQGEEITLDVDHIDGNFLDNRKENLRFLCPNCHRQTPTFGRSKASLSEENKLKLSCACGRSKQAKSKTCAFCYATKRNSSKSPKTCLDCDNEIDKDSTRCSKHYHDSRKGKLLSPDKRKIDWPKDEILISNIKESNYSVVAKALGVSDNGIRKHLRVRGYDTKTLTRSKTM